MNYKFLKLLFTNLNNLEIILFKSESMMDFPDSNAFDKHLIYVNHLKDRVKEYEDTIKSYIENHK